MRTSRSARRAAGVAMAAAAAAGVLLPLGAHRAGAAPAQRVVTFHGYRVSVPAGWPVIDLTRQPTACVRFDRPAVYLGHPGAQQDCPAHLVGRTDTLLVEPLDAAASGRAGGAATAPAGRAAAAAPTSADGQIAVAVPAAGVLVTATHGADQRAVRQILGTAQLAADAVPAAAAPTTRRHLVAVPAVVTPAGQPGDVQGGRGFDACTAPSAAQLHAWLASPYRTVGVYIGGVSRACAQPNLTASWVTQQTAAGWHLIPIHVGLQAPCTSFSNRLSTDPATATGQGRSAAADAAAKAQALGIGPGSTLYNDMENYDSGNATCRTAVLSFLSGWTQGLHENAYQSGVYSSVSAGIRDLAAGYGSTTLARPDHVWLAWWNGVADTEGGSALPGRLWPNHQRLHQYAGGHNESWGGVTINIDNDFLDVTPPVRRDFATYQVLQSGSTGAAVSAAQYLLNDGGYGPIAVDGLFGPQTQAAVAAFQSASGLPADGTLSAHTWTALLSAGYRPALQQGSTGLDVSRLQRALTAALGRAVTIDGSFGPATTQAVRDYQTSRGLGVDGIAGTATWAALQTGR